MTPRLPARLRGLLSLIPDEAGCVADIGAGHGALSARLAQSGRRVIATEAKPGPYDELCRNLARWRVADRVDVRRGPGLSPLGPGEVDAAVVAGMGGHTVLAIAGGARSQGVGTLVLQCMQRHHLVEPWVEERGWAVLGRLDAHDGGRVYPTWLVQVAPAP